MERQVTRDVTEEVTRDITVDVQKEVTQQVEAGFLLQSFDANGKALNSATRLNKTDNATYDAELLFNLDLNNDSARGNGVNKLNTSSSDITGEDLLIDTVIGYQLKNEEENIALKDLSGRTISKETSPSWDALVATESSNGYQVLLQGQEDQAGNYNLWQANSQGIIQGASGWKSGAEAAEAGWEQVFSVDLNGNKEVERFME